MDIEASDYNSLGGNMIDIGKGLIDGPQHSQNGQYVLDIGCGDGKLTELISNQIEGLLTLYGVDIDKKMIDFAIQNYSESVGQNRIHYLTQDFGVQWNQMRPELRELEGKVAIIFTNLTLHWIYANKENVSQNMSRLLAKNGKIYANIFCFPNKNTETDVNFLAIFKQIPSIPTKEEQQKEWLDSFGKADLDLISNKLRLFNIKLIIEEFEKANSLMIWPLSQQFLKSDKEKIRAHKIIEAVPTFDKVFKDESTGKMMCESKIQYFQFVLEKKSQ